MSTSEFDADRPPQTPRHPDKGKPRRAFPDDGTRRERGGPGSVVPDAEIRSYYGQNVVKPPPWENAIAYYLWLGGMAAGSGIIAVGADMTHRHRLRERARYAGLASIGLGSVALVADLGRPERALNMMRTAKLTSPMSVGSWILAGFGTFTGGAAALELVKPLLPQDSWFAELRDVVDPFVGAGAAFFAPPLAAYTAVLFADTAVPLWHQSYKELPFLFCASGTGAGAGLNLIISPVEECAPVRALAATAAACDLTADALLERRLGEEGQPLHEGVARRFHTAAKVLTAVGGVTAAVAGRRKALNVAAGACLVAGSLCTRFAVYKAGMASAEDPVYTIRPQRRRFDEKVRQGKAVTQPGGEWPT